MKHRSIGPKAFLFLQGPPGPFFARLGEALAKQGHAVHRINLNGGDRHDWPAGGTDFRGTAEGWPRFFESFVQKHGITDLVLFGDCRPMHRAAHGMATLSKLRIHVFEEGYIRPDWVTLELDGVNGHSTLSRDPEFYRQATRTLPPLPTPPAVPASFARRARDAFGYYSAMTFGRLRFPHHQSHRPGSILLEGAGWIRRLASRKRARERATEVLESLGQAPYFLFPLQLNSDHQIRIHSPFGNMKVAIEYVIESFARAAPPEAMLVIKEHPLDNGLVNWRRLVAARATAHGIADRIRYLEEGDIARLVEGAAGLVTINSTTGTLALGAGVPVAVLGQAVYHIPGITHQGPFDRFWVAPRPPRPEIWDGFCRVLLDRCLIRGGFASDEGIDLLVENAIPRLTDGRDAVVDLVDARVAFG